MDQKPASLYRSPREALKAPEEEFLYLACLREVGLLTRPTSWPWSTPRRDGSCTRLRCRTSATSFTTSAETQPRLTRSGRSHAVATGTREVSG